jgi:hypothetical protein
MKPQAMRSSVGSTVRSRLPMSVASSARRQASSAAADTSLGLMPGRALDVGEWRAAKAVASLLGGNVVAHDLEGSPDGSYDFDVLLADGRTVALEVTTPRTAPSSR